VLMASLDQKRASLQASTTLIDALTGGGSDYVTINNERRHVIGYMKDFLFAPEQANTPVGVLSGGERARLTLALAFAKPSNLLVLDEPTNDLDLETLELLQELLADYSGTVLLVSHDRDFIDRVVTSVIATEGDGRWIEYAGGYSDMLAQRGPVRTVSMGANARPKVEAQPRTAGAKRMTFKDRHALETLPARIAGLEAEAATLTARLEDPDLYTRDPARFSATTAALDAARRALAEAEERWLELEMRREELEGSTTKA